MRALTSIVLLVSAALGCGSAPATVEAPSPAAPPPAEPPVPATVEAPSPLVPVVGELALVRGDAALRLAPTEDAPVVRLDDPAEPDRLPFYAIRVAAVSDEWIEVESVEEAVAGGQCAEIWWRMGDYRLRFFVRPGDVLPVVRTAIDHRDGAARWLIEAGEPLVETGDGLALARKPWGLTRVPLSIDRASAGRSYTRATLLGDDERMPGARVRLSDLGLPYAWAEPDQEVDVAAGEAIRDGQWVTLRSWCTTLSVVVAPDVVSEIGWGSGSGFGSRAPVHRAPAGTEVRWENGAAAGETLRDVSYSQQGVMVGELRCFDVRVGKREDEGLLRVCHRAADLQPPAGQP